MRQHVMTLSLAVLISAAATHAMAGAGDDDDRKKHSDRHDESVQLGPRPFFLVNDMKSSALKNKLLSCSDGPFEKTDFSIGHRGAALLRAHQRACEAGAWAQVSSVTSP